MSAQQVECVSMKLLLKQVYAAHTSKIKDLEREIKDLKSKVHEKDRKIHEVESNCKRCSELEEAFKSCKAALCEQSKRFEDLGQKFSVFGDFEKKASERAFIMKSDSCKEASFSSENQGIDVIASCVNNPNACGKLPNETSEDNISKKLTVTSVGKQNLLKNVMSECEESFDLCTVTFPQNLISEDSYLKSDSVILAPDSLDVIKNDKKTSLNSKQNTKEVCNFTEVQQNLKHSESNYVEDTQQNSKLNRKKCLNPVPTNSSTKRSNAESELECMENKKAKVVQLFSENNTISNHSKVIETQNEAIDSTVKTSYRDLKASAAKLKKNITPVLDVVICKTGNNAKDSCCNKDILNVSNKETSHEKSPSLLPLKENLMKLELDNIKQLSSDNDDFQPPMCNAKMPENVGAWERCDKRKLLQKVHKTIRTSSKFKMTLDAPPPNYKKPTYRQTKLSKSIFLVKHSKNIQKENSLEPIEKENVSSDNLEKHTESVLFSDFQTSTPVIEKTGNSAADFDATCIPENFGYVVTPCGISKAQVITTENSVLLLDSNFSEEEVCGADHRKLAQALIDDKVNDQDDSSIEDGDCMKLVNSFDRVPSPVKPKYKYKEQTVRKKCERKQLDGFDCKECEKYYSALGLSDKEKKERMKKCSRHRAKFALPPTPDHFWELEFPDTEECKARGYLNETQKCPLNPPKRRLPL